LMHLMGLEAAYPKPRYEIYVKERANGNPMQASTMHLIQPYFLS